MKFRNYLKWAHYARIRDESAKPIKIWYTLLNIESIVQKKNRLRRFVLPDALYHDGVLVAKSKETKIQKLEQIQRIRYSKVPLDMRHKDLRVRVGHLEHQGRVRTEGIVSP